MSGKNYVWHKKQKSVGYNAIRFVERKKGGKLVWSLPVSYALPSPTVQISPKCFYLNKKEVNIFLSRKKCSFLKRVLWKWCPCYFLGMFKINHLNRKGFYAHLLTILFIIWSVYKRTYVPSNSKLKEKMIIRCSIINFLEEEITVFF